MSSVWTYLIRLADAIISRLDADVPLIQKGGWGSKKTLALVNDKVQLVYALNSPFLSLKPLESVIDEPLSYTNWSALFIHKNSMIWHIDFLHQNTEADAKNIDFKMEIDGIDVVTGMINLASGLKVALTLGLSSDSLGNSNDMVAIVDDGSGHCYPMTCKSFKLLVKLHDNDAGTLQRYSANLRYSE